MLIIGIKEISPFDKGETSRLESELSPFYQDYILSPIREKEGELQLAHSASRLACVQMLHEFCKHKFAKLPNFTVKSKGKPCFDDSDVYFSLSHSEDIAVCAVSFPGDDEKEVSARTDFVLLSDCMGEEKEFFNVCDSGAPCAFVICDTARECVGADVQVVKSEDADLSYRHEKIAERFFDEKQSARLTACPTEENFIRLWTELESLSKMTGEGVASYDKKTKEGAKTITLCYLDSKNKRYYISVAYR